MINKFLTKSDNIERSGVLWNAIANVLVAFQSVFFLVFLTNESELGIVGLFTLANAYSNQFLTIGKYGMRAYQVSDTNNNYSFSEYRFSRLVTSLLMVIFSLLFVMFSSINNSYSVYKAAVIIGMCFSKLPDAIEDVYYGDYQKSGRLDIGSKAISLRMMVTIAIWIMCFVVLDNILISVVASALVSFILMYYFIALTKDHLNDSRRQDLANVWSLLKSNAPLCASTFLILFIGNIPRYSIDHIMSDDIQGVYGLVSMPVFIVQLTSTFFINPVFHDISCFWNENRILEYIKESLRQFVIVAIISLFFLVGTFFLGVPILSAIYGVSIAPYKFELVMMIAGGGLLALVTELTSLLVVMRKQKVIIIAYILGLVIAFMTSDNLVVNYGIRGAVYNYLTVFGILNIILIVPFVYCVIKKLERMRMS